MIAFYKYDYDIQNPKRFNLRRVFRGEMYWKIFSVFYMKLVEITTTLSIHVSISLIIH